MARKLKYQKKTLYGGRVLEISEMPLNKATVDAIIFPTDANFRSMEKSCEVLKEAMGEELEKNMMECAKRHRILRPTYAVVHKASKITSKYLVFSNIPPYTGHNSSDNSKRQLQQSIHNSLNECETIGVKTVGIPTIGKEFPISFESEAVVKGIVAFHFSSPKNSIKNIILLPQDEDSLYAYSAEMASLE